MVVIEVRDLADKKIGYVYKFTIETDIIICKDKEDAKKYDFGIRTDRIQDILNHSFMELVFEQKEV